MLNESLTYQRLYRDTVLRNNHIVSICWVFVGYSFVENHWTHVCMFFLMSGNKSENDSENHSGNDSGNNCGESGNDSRNVSGNDASVCARDSVCESGRCRWFSHILGPCRISIAFYPVVARKTTATFQ